MRIKSIKSISIEKTREMTVEIQNTIKGYLEEKGVPNASTDKYLSKVQTTNASMTTDIQEKIQQSITQTASQDQVIDYTDNIGRCDEDGKGKLLKQNAIVEMLATSIISSVFKNMVDIKEFNDIEIEMTVQKEPSALIKNLVFFINFILPFLIILILYLISLLIKWGYCLLGGPVTVAKCAAEEAAKQAKEKLTSAKDKLKGKLEGKLRK